MEIVSEIPTIPETPIQPEPANSEQKPETPATPELETPKNGSSDEDEKKGRAQNDVENSKCECRTATPDEKTEKKQSLATETGQRVKFRGIEFPVNGTPNRLKLPKAFKYPERYSSPTDMMMSPISKGLLARTRKGALPSKMHELRITEMSLQS